MNIYREHILEHYRNPRNAGVLEYPTYRHKAVNPLCGDAIEVFITGGDRVDEIRFQGEGCAISQAAASLFFETVKGKPFQEVTQMKPEHVVELLGTPLTPSRMNCALLPLRALTGALARTTN